MELWDELLLNLWAYLIVGAGGLVVAVGCFAIAPRLVRRPLPLPRLPKSRPNSPSC